MCAKALRIGGFVPLTTLDYPDQLSAVIFCQGCPWRCRYCHNAELIPSRSSDQFSWESIYHILEHRRRWLDAVVFSGGEPTFQPALETAIEALKKLGFKIGLHTAGMYPKRMKALMPLLDWVGLDIKHLPEKYPIVTQTQQSSERVWDTLQLLLAAHVDFECRTTVHWDLLTSGEVLSLAETLSQLGVKHYRLQLARTTKCLDSTLNSQVTGQMLKDQISAHLTHRFETFMVRDI